LDAIGYGNRITGAVIQIDTGRKGFATKGKAEEGRVFFELGIANSKSIFKEVQVSADPLALFFAEYTFITQELALCDKSDQDTINSLTKAKSSFDDAFLALKAVEGSCYKAVDQATPRDTKYRFKGYPLDAYHVACHSHITRLRNILKVPGIDPIEKDLLKQRLANMKTAQEAYAERQKKALEK